MATRSRIICFGDVIDDVVVIPNGALREDTDTPSTIRFVAGGSAANTAAWLGELGADVDLVASVGEGDAARHAAALGGVRTHLTERAGLPTGTIVVLVDGERRHMLTERGANTALDPATVTDALLDDAAVLHITGHTLLNPLALGDLVDRAGRAGVAVSVSPGSAGFLQDIGVARFLEAFAGASIVFASLDEGRVITGLVEPAEVAAALPFPHVVLTLGRDGVLAGVDEHLRVPAVRASAVDPTGAGDAFCAGYLAEWVASGNVHAAAIAGTQTAARAVETVGARPLSSRP
ncbi:sugar/nucleoside kinase (ribokinase family) [Microbacteriaceae bacterium SG_E_30_P1]|uniref:Sugar/nucleoside kinase (Ribokinase family) n=1 Tax=Antiquaquibacter oligotrophicus TaxID=2880260 RepID=A0ABT6KQ23_9MICO|nr:PfkB family carbohydrate kinase [Antiquaquibacter oligotrophicus]MDH6182069.1 sugar/nucleoside kinase (ribokinase family) [Antiquaquibacter oligotrophicus]UDF12264.1 PfkB family carbohydrate kinase [Antiquaquibacter oligotrophicus]